MKQVYEEQGYFIAKNVINDNEVQSLIDSLSIFDKDINQYGIRDLMNKLPRIRELALFFIPKLELGNEKGLVH